MDKLAIAVPVVLLIILVVVYLRDPLRKEMKRHCHLLKHSMPSSKETSHKTR